MVEVVVGVEAVDVTAFKICSPAFLTVVTALAAMVVAAVVAAPNTLPECLKVCLRMTSGDYKGNVQRYKRG